MEQKVKEFIKLIEKTGDNNGVDLYLQSLVKKYKNDDSFINELWSQIRSEFDFEEFRLRGYDICKIHNLYLGIEVFEEEAVDFEVWTNYEIRNEVLSQDLRSYIDDVLSLFNSCASEEERIPYDEDGVDEDTAKDYVKMVLK
jgi:hypothetical protein